MNNKYLILGIETSCDETSISVVSSDKEILSLVTSSQIKLHQQYGGVVPELAARAHVDLIPHILQSALEAANISMDDISLISATQGPGLIGGVMVGLTFAKALSLVHNIPFVGVNHLAGHALTVRLTSKVDFPFLLLLVSGGHCQFLIVTSPIEYVLLGETIDDALGECFDKVAKTLGLPYPGGPEIEKYAALGKNIYTLPKPLYDSHNANFSFSGLKTSCKLLIEKLMPLDDNKIADVACSFQNTIAAILIRKIQNASALYRTNLNVPSHQSINLVLAGGVAANQFLRNAISTSIPQINLVAPPLKLCTDNAAMIAWAGYEKFMLQGADSLDIEPKARISLNQN